MVSVVELAGGLLRDLVEHAFEDDSALAGWVGLDVDAVLALVLL